ITLPYSEDVILNYKKLLDLPDFVLLESTDRIRGRYDIVSACAYEKIKISSGATCTTALFSMLHEKIKPCAYRLDLPFQGGAIGFFSYDLACALAGIAST